MMRKMGIRTAVPAMVAASLLMSSCGSEDDTAQAAPRVSASEEASSSAPAAPDFTDRDAIAVAKAIGRAYNEYDADLFLASTTEDFVFVDERGSTPRATQASYFPGLRDGRHQATPSSKPVVISKDPFVVAVDTVVTADFYPPEGRVGTSTYTLEVEDGELKVQEHRWTGDSL